MISNEEHQEVMQRLRRNVLRDQDVSMTAVIKALGIECDGGESWGELCEAVWDRMCDLIDRPTCRNLAKPHGMAPVGAENWFECSECHCKAQMNKIGMPLSYCPNCGAEVIE